MNPKPKSIAIFKDSATSPVKSKVIQQGEYCIYLCLTISPISSRSNSLDNTPMLTFDRSRKHWHFTYSVLIENVCQAFGYSHF